MSEITATENFYDYDICLVRVNHTEHAQQRSKIKLQEQRGVWRRLDGVLRKRQF